MIYSHTDACKATVQLLHHPNNTQIQQQKAALSLQSFQHLEAAKLPDLRDCPTAVRCSKQVKKWWLLPQPNPSFWDLSADLLIVLTSGSQVKALRTARAGECPCIASWHQSLAQETSRMSRGERMLASMACLTYLLVCLRHLLAR